VSSRFLVGVGAWLLGAVTATTGSMIAVGQLANGLLSTQSQQLGGSTSSADLDAGHGLLTPAVSPTPSASPAASPAATLTPAVSPTSAAGSAAPQSAAPTLLTSADGSVLATCQAGGAYLVYWSPAQGYSADDVVRGPAQDAKVTFSNQAGGVVMRVSCSSGTPVAHLYWITPGPSGSPTDE
jgi:hypothetical protein